MRYPYDMIFASVSCAVMGELGAPLYSNVCNPEVSLRVPSTAISRQRLPCQKLSFASDRELEANLLRFANLLGAQKRYCTNHPWLSRQRVGVKAPKQQRHVGNG